MSVQESEIAGDRKVHPDFDILNDHLEQIDNEDPNVTQYDVEKKILSLKLLLEKDMKAVDFKWSLFVAACHTYRFDTCLKPFPPLFIKNNVPDIEGLVSWNNFICYLGIETYENIIFLKFFFVRLRVSSKLINLSLWLIELI